MSRMIPSKTKPYDGRHNSYFNRLFIYVKRVERKCLNRKKDKKQRHSHPYLWNAMVIKDKLNVKCCCQCLLLWTRLCYDIWVYTIDRSILIVCLVFLGQLLPHSIFTLMCNNYSPLVLVRPTNWGNIILCIILSFWQTKLYESWKITMIFIRFRVY